MKHAFLGIALAGLLSHAAWADEPVEAVTDVQIVPVDSIHYGVDTAQAERIGNILIARGARKGSVIFFLSHRAYESFTKDPFYDGLGFDGGSLKIGLGLRYGILDSLDVGILRLNGTVEVFDTYEFDARFQVLRQERHGIDVAVRAGVSWFAQKGHEDASGYLAQLLADRIFADRCLVGAGLLFHSSSSNDRKTIRDDKPSLAGTAFAEYRFLRALAVDLEGAMAIAGYHSKYPTVSAGFKAYTNRHTFSLLVTNTQYTGADGVVSNTWRSRPSEWILGFNLTREF